MPDIEVDPPFCPWCGGHPRLYRVGSGPWHYFTGPELPDGDRRICNRCFFNYNGHQAAGYQDTDAVWRLDGGQGQGHGDIVPLEVSVSIPAWLGAWTKPAMPRYVWEVSVGTYGSPRFMGFIEAETSQDALGAAHPLYGDQCAENEMLVVRRSDAEKTPPPPPRPTVWSRLRQWEV